MQAATASSVRMAMRMVLPFLDFFSLAGSAFTSFITCSSNWSKKPSGTV